MSRFKDFAEAEALFGAIEGNEWKRASEFMVVHPVPELPWINAASGGKVTKIYMNKEMVPAFTRALEHVLERGLAGELKTYDGCFYIRKVRGGKGMSAHSYGLALDINAAENGLGLEPKLTPALVACFTDAGFDWGGNFTRKDGMHFSFAWE